MGAKHTPGPWRTMFTGSGWTVNYDGPDHHWLVATVNETPFIGHHAANAEVIAAAPNLLSFAIEYLWAEHGEISESHEASCLSKEQLRDRARAVIAKASGKEDDYATQN